MRPLRSPPGVIRIDFPPKLGPTVYPKPVFLIDFSRRHGARNGRRRSSGSSNRSTDHPASPSTNPAGSSVTPELVPAPAATSRVPVPVPDEEEDLSVMGPQDEAKRSQVRIPAFGLYSSQFKSLGQYKAPLDQSGPVDGGINEIQPMTTEELLRVFVLGAALRNCLKSP